MEQLHWTGLTWTATARRVRASVVADYRTLPCLLEQLWLGVPQESVPRAVCLLPLKVLNLADNQLTTLPVEIHLVLDHGKVSVRIQRPVQLLGPYGSWGPLTASHTSGTARILAT